MGGLLQCIMGDYLSVITHVLPTSQNESSVQQDSLTKAHEQVSHLVAGRKVFSLKSLQQLTYAHFSVTLSTAFPLPVPTEKVRSVEITIKGANDFFGI